MNNKTILPLPSLPSFVNSMKSDKDKPNCQVFILRKSMKIIFRNIMFKTNLLVFFFCCTIMNLGQCLLSFNLCFRLMFKYLYM